MTGTSAVDYQLMVQEGVGGEYAAVRRDSRGREFFDPDSLAFTPDGVRARVERTRLRLPQWADENEVVRIAHVKTIWEELP